MEIALLIIGVVIIALLAVLLVLILKKNNSEQELAAVISRDTARQQSELRQELGAQTQSSVSAMGMMLERRLQGYAMTNERQLDSMRETMEKRLEYIQADNNRKLEEMRQTVDEKLNRTLEEKMNRSFSLVSERLEQVYKGLGEMQSLAVGVGDLKKVLSNVKTRGILGEIQLGAILSEVLAPSKFPGDTYLALREAIDSGDRERIEACEKTLLNTLRNEARDIHDKYIDPPHTTDFAILFLPFEGLYSEVVNRGMVEELQRRYKVSLAGPSTMAALLNALQMGFRTLAVQKRSAEVWEVLRSVKKEFDSFADVLEKTQTRLEQANRELDDLVGVRTRQMQRQLAKVQTQEALKE